MKFIFFFSLFFINASLNGQIITTFAGNGTIGSYGNGVPATTAQLYGPEGICADNSGNIYIADHENHIVRKVNTAGIITTFAGNGTLGYSGDGGLATNAQLKYPYSVCADNAGNIYVSDDIGYVIRKITSAGIISTFAGTGQWGNTGDGGPAVLAQVGSVTDICADNAGNIYMADFSKSVVRKINTAGIISTIAGNGVWGNYGNGGPAILSQLQGVTGISVDNIGNVYIAEAGNMAIRKINSAGIISIFAGGIGGYSGDGGPATAAALSFPYSVHADVNGNVYIGDTRNHVVRKVNSAGIISTIAGNGTSGYSGDGGSAIGAQLVNPGDICLDPAGNIYVTDGNNFVVRKITNCLLSVISKEPVNQVVCSSNGNTSFEVTCSNALSYQWQVNPGSGWNDLFDNSIYAGSATGGLNITAASAVMNNYQFRCKVKNACGNVFSLPATLTVTTPSTPLLNIGTATNVICTGNVTTFTATPVNGGSSPSYQWKKNGLDVGNSSSFYIDNSLMNSDVISCVFVSNGSCLTTNSAASNSIIMTVNSVLTASISISPSSNNICSGTIITFSSAVTNGGTNPSYQWNKNGISVGTNSLSYIDNGLINGDVISCVLTAAYSCLTSAASVSNKVQMNIMPLVTPSVVISTLRSSVCTGATVTFTSTTANAGPSPFYQWKKNGIITGTTASTYIDNNVLTGDITSCTVTAIGNCLAASTATSNSITMNVLKEPVVVLDHTASLCMESSRLLDAGSFASYLWNDGTGGRALLIHGTGTYYVTVTDNNGCKGSDTSKITTILLQPINFLPPDTSICSYGSLALIAKPSYKSYTWNNNSTGSSIIIAKAGVYWLEVTDNNNCRGKDSILVLQKDCQIGFYIPTAFTPNSDAMNDFFKPFLFGKVISYKFFIYNRWGQTIFQTTELTKGWNGHIGSIQTDGNVFTWVCSYRFEGEAQELKKGTVLLIR